MKDLLAGDQRPTDQISQQGREKSGKDRNKNIQNAYQRDVDFEIFGKAGQHAPSMAESMER